MHRDCNGLLLPRSERAKQIKREVDQGLDPLALRDLSASCARVAPASGGRHPFGACGSIGANGKKI